MKFFGTVFFVMLLSCTLKAQNVVVSIVLNPMGDFKAKTSDLKGEAVMNGDEVSAQNVVVGLSKLKTGIELRDKHTAKYLDVKNHPEALLISATGKGGKGKGRIKIRGIEKDISGTYKVEGKILKATFKLNLSDFGINDINYMGVGVEDEISLAVEIPVKS